MCTDKELRYFNYYDSKRRLPNQIILLEKLEDMGFEQDGNYILTNRKLGVPISIMLLLMKESLDILNNEQEMLNGIHQVIDLKTNEQIMDEFQIKVIPSLTKDLTISSWQYKQVSYLDSTPEISGSTSSRITTLLVPTNYFSHSIKGVFYSENPNIVVHNDIIEVKPEKVEKRSMINIFKNTVQYLEFSYSVSERMEAEKKKFLKLLYKDFEIPKKGSFFGSNCMKRKDFIHGGNLNIGINPKDSQILLGKSNLMTSINQGFDEACEWVDSIYEIMVSII